MDEFVFFFGAGLLIILILFFGIPYLIYHVFRKLGNRKLGRVVSFGIFSIFVCFAVYVCFEDHFFFKYSARRELQQLGLVLNEDFEILRNESEGFRDYYHVFELRISKGDTERLVRGKDFKGHMVVIKRQDLAINVSKEVTVNPDKHTLTFEHIIN